MKLDESMRARVRALAEKERSPGLDTPARERAEQAARLARGADDRHRHLVFHGLTVTSALALVIAVIAGLESNSPPLPPSLARKELAPPAAQPSAPVAVAAESPAAAVGACALEANLSFSAGGAQRRLDLGARALLVANHGAVVAATQSADCDLHAALADGDLAVHARDLQGRSLVVSTPRGDVRVKGTIFQVEFYAASGEMTVAVEEGRVELVTREGKTVSLAAGEGAYLGINLELEPFDDDDRARLRRLLGLSIKRKRGAESEPESPEQKAPSEEAPVRAWRSGNVESPEQAPELGSSVTEDGRPMKKPKLKKRSEERREAQEPGEQE